MSVTPETHQPAMGPYLAVAAAAFELYSMAAVFREALSAKLWPVQAGGEGEGGGGEGEGGGGEGEGGGGGEKLGGGGGDAEIGGGEGGHSGIWLQ